MTSSVETTATVQPAEAQLYDCRDAFENKLRELASHDHRIVPFKTFIDRLAMG